MARASPHIRSIRPVPGKKEGNEQARTDHLHWSFDAPSSGFTQAALSVSRSGAAVGKENEQGKSDYFFWFPLSHRGAFAISTMTACRPETTRDIRSY